MGTNQIQVGRQDYDIYPKQKRKTQSWIFDGFLNLEFVLKPTFPKSQHGNTS